jgi:hypothetical protein
MNDLLEKSGKLPENWFVVFSYFTEILKCPLSSCRVMGVLTLLPGATFDAAGLPWSYLHRCS